MVQEVIQLENEVNFFETSRVEIAYLRQLDFSQRINHLIQITVI